MFKSFGNFILYALACLGGYMVASGLGLNNLMGYIIIAVCVVPGVVEFIKVIFFDK